MRKKILFFTPLLFFGISFISCWNLNWRYNVPIRDEAYVPIYGFDSTLRTIQSLPAQPTINPGKVYTIGHYLFQVELSEGIHIIDYSSTLRPRKLGFIKISGCQELAMKNQYLFTNNMNDMVSIDVSDPTNAKLVSRINGAFKMNNFYVYRTPPVRGVYYVCPDNWQGDVIGWKLEKKVSGASCYN